MPEQPGHPPRRLAPTVGRPVIAVLALALMLPAGADELPRPRLPVRVSALMALTDFLHAGQPPDRIHFAGIALEELARSYDTEVFTADPEDKRNDDQQAESRWRSAAWDYAQSILELRAQLGRIDDVQVIVDPGQVLRLVIGERQVILDPPRLDGEDDLEARIAGRFCRIAACPPPETVPDGGEDRRRRLWANWSFGRGQPPVLETSTGLHFRFADGEVSPARREAARELVGALDRLAVRLAWFRQRGLPVDWPALHLAALPGSGRAALVVNRAGDYLALEAPWRALPAPALQDWFRHRLAGRPARHIFDNAGEIFPLPAADAPGARSARH